MIGAFAPLLVLVVLAAVVILLAVRRDRRRRRAMEAVGIALGLRYTRRRTGLRETLEALPAMRAPGAHVFAHVLEGPDAIVADWRVRRGPKDPGRGRPRTIAAFRRAGSSMSPSCEEHPDRAGHGLGTLVLECGGEWVACYGRDRRVPDDAISAFREHARILADSV